MSHFFIKNLYGEYIAKNFSLNKDDNKYLLELESTNDSVLCPFCHKKTSRIHQKTKRKIQFLGKEISINRKVQYSLILLVKMLYILCIIFLFPFEGWTLKENI